MAQREPGGHVGGRPADPARVPTALIGLGLVAAAGYVLYARFGAAIVQAAHGVIALPVLLGLAVVGGAASFFSPCSIVFAPTFLMVTGSAEDSRRSLIGRAAWVALGIVAFYGVVGWMVGLVGAAVYGALAYLIPALGVVFLWLGASVLAGRTGVFDRLGRMNPALLGYESASGSQPGGRKSLFGVGVLYGAGAHGCSLPIFLGIVLAPLAAGNIGAAILTILVYGLSLAAFLLLTVTLGRQAMPVKGHLWGEQAQRASGWMFALIGLYLLVYFAKDFHVLV